MTSSQSDQGCARRASRPEVLALFGPTASGKSAVAEVLAARIPAVLISADAMQVYRGLPILTNQSAGVELVGIWDLAHEGSLGEYAPLAHAAVDAALAAGRTPVLVGGTGLYLRAALVELELPPSPPPGARAAWERHYDELGAERAHGGGLHRVRVLGNADLRLHTEEPRCIRDRLPVVPRRGGDDAARAFVGAQLRHEVDAAPDLEGADRLMVLVLDEHLRAD